MTEYIYTVIREYPDGSRARRCRTISRYKPLVVGGLYTHIGAGFPGMQRILSVKTKEILD